MAINDSTNKYTANRIIVDAGGTTPFITIAQGIAQATALGLTNTEIFIRPGTYTENLTLVAGINLNGASQSQVTVIGHHTIPLAGNIFIQNIRFEEPTAATDIFTETGASSCICRFRECYFYPNNAASFNLPTSTGTINLMKCNGSAITSDSVFNNAGTAKLYLNNTFIGAGNVSATCNGVIDFRISALSCPVTISGAGTGNIIGCTLANALTLNDTAIIGIYDSQFITGAITPITVNAGTAIVLSDVTINSSAANIVTGAGTCKYGSITCLNSTAHNATTETYGTRVISGSLQLDETNAGVPYFTAGVMGSTAALTSGQLIIGSTGNPPSVATLTAGSGTTITNGAGSITVAQTAGFPFTFTTIAADGALVSGNAYVNTKAAALSVSLPATSTVGDVIILQGGNAATTGWTITQAANQQILIGDTNSTLGAGGSIASSNKGDSVSLVCTTANLEWRVFGMVGNITVV